MLFSSSSPKMNDAWLEEYKVISFELNKINTTQTALKVQPAFKGDKAAFREKMTQAFKGHSIRSNVFEELAGKYADFGAMFKDLDNAAALTKAKAQAFMDEFRDSLFDLLSYQIPNSFEVTYHGKPLKSHSLGQRASAMMLFLLGQDDHD